MADFTATVNVDINDSQLSSVEQRLDALNNKKISIDLDTKGINNIQSQLNQLNNIKIDKINVNTGTITQTLNKVGINAGRSFANSFKNGISDLNMQKLTTGISELETKFASLGDKGSAFSTQLSKIRSEIENFDKNATPKQQEKNFRNLTNEINELNLKYRELNAETKNATQSMSLLSGRNILGNQIQTWMNNNTKAAKVYAAQLEQLQAQLKTVSSGTELKNIRQQFNELTSAASAEGLTGKGFLGSLFSNLTKLSPLFGMGAMISAGIRGLKSMYTSVVELDTALVDLQKTSSASASELNQFYEDANQIAKQYGTTTKQIIQSAADWSRLDYNIKDSKTMSQLSSQFAAISPGVSVEDVTSGLVSTMKSYGIEANDVLDGIMSKINIVGNSFAVSNGDVLEGLKRSSAAMAAMGQDFDSTVALFTGMNEVLQNAETSGTILRNMSLRIRGFDEETEQLSDDLVGITGKIIDYTKTAEHAQGVSIFTDETQTEYKDFVQYFKELSEVWDEMDAKSRQGLLNDLFGKRGAQGGAALIQNFDTVEAALEKMSDSAGNADKEMEIIQNSLEYKVNAMKETFVGIGQNLFKREDMGIAIDGLTKILEVIDALTEKLGLFGTIGAGAGIAAFVKNFESLKNIGNVISELGGLAQFKEVLTMMGGTSFANMTQLSGMVTVFKQMGDTAKGMTALKEVNTILSTMGTSKAGLEAVGHAMQGLSAKSAEAITGLLGLNAAQIETVLSAYGLEGAELAEAVATTAAGTAAAGATGGFAALTASVVAATQAVMAFLLTNPIGWAILAGAAIFGVTRAVQAHQKSVEEARQAAEEGASTFQDSQKSLQDYITEIENLKTKLAEGTLSEMEAYEAKQRLAEIQSELYSTYGEEATGLDLVNGKLETQIGLVNQLTKADANRYLNENRDAIAEAEKKMTETMGGDGNWLVEAGKVLGTSYNYEDNQKIREIVKKYADNLKIDEMGDGSIRVRFVGDASQAQEVLNDFMTDVREAEKEMGETEGLESMFQGAGNILSEADEIIDKYSAIYEAAKEAKLMADETFYEDSAGNKETAAKRLSDYAEAIEAYNKAMLGGKESEIVAARETYQNMHDEIHGMLESDEGFAQYADNVTEIESSLDSATEHAIEFKEALSGDSTDATAQSIRSLSNELKDLGMTKGEFLDNYFFDPDNLNQGTSAVKDLVSAAQEMGYISMDASQGEIESFVDFLGDAGVLAQDAVTETETALEGLSGTLSDLDFVLKDDSDNGFTKRLSSYKEQLDTLKNAYDSWDKGELGVDAMVELQTQFAELNDYDMSNFGVGLQNAMQNVIGSLDDAGTKFADFKEKVMDSDESVQNAIKNLSGITRADFMKTFLDGATNQYSDAMTVLKNAAEAYGVVDSSNQSSVETFCNQLIDLGVVQGDLYDVTSKSTGMMNLFDEAIAKVGGEKTDAGKALVRLRENMLSIYDTASKGFTFNIDAEVSDFGNLYSALQESYSGKGLSSGAIDNIKKMYGGLEGFNADKLFERTANGVHLNEEALKSLQMQYENLKKQSFANELSNLSSEYEKSRQRAEELKSATEGLSQAEIDAQLASEGLRPVSSILDDISNVELLIAEFDGLTSAYNKWQQAQSAGNERDSFESVAKGYEEMQKVLDQGWYGDESLNGYLDLMLSASQRTGDAVADFEKLGQTIEGTSHSLKDYFTFEDGNLVSDGLFDFLDDVNAKLGDSFATIDENGQYTFDFTGEKLQQVAQEFGTTTEFIQLMERAMIDAGMAVEMSSSEFETMKEALGDLQSQGKISPEIDLDIDTATASLEDIDNLIEQLNEQKAEIEVNSDGSEETKQTLETLDRTINSLNGQKVTKSIQVAIENGNSIDELLAMDNTTLAATLNIDDSQVESARQQLEALNGVTEETTVTVKLDSSQFEALTDTSKTVTVKYETDTSEPDGYKPDDKEATVKYKKDSSIPDGYQPSDKYATVHYSADTSGLPTSFSTITRYVNYVKTGDTSVTGTAHAQGTAKKGKSFANGNRTGDWGTKTGGIALGGELGEELLVRDGKFYTIGANSAEFFQYKPGDIIFNADQTKQIFEKGKITTGSKRGKSFVSGTAFDSGSGGRRRNNSGGNSNNNSGGNNSSGGGGSNNNSSNNNNNSNNNDKKEPERIDWIAVAIDRAERAIKRLKTLADSVFKSFSSRNKNLAKEISKTTAEIKLQEKAQKRYKKEFNAVVKENGLSKDIVKKIKDGSINIKKYDEDTQKAITEAKKFWDAALDCKDAITKLNESLSELYKQQFELIVTKWEKALQNLQHTAERVESRINRRTSYASDYVAYSETRSASSGNIKDYRSLVNNAVNQRTKRQQELNELNKDLNKKVKSGKIKKGSEAYYDMLQEIQEVENEIDNLNQNIIDYSNSISEQYKNIFDSWSNQYESKLELIEHTSNEVNNALDLAEEKGRLGVTKYYSDLKSLEQKNIKTLTEEREKLQTAMYNALASGEIEKGSQAYYDMQTAINGVTESIQSAQLEVAKLNNEIRQVKWDNFDYLQNRISRVSSEADFLIDLLENEKLYEDNGQLTSAGMSTMGLRGVNYNVYMKQADDYAQQIKEINKEIAKDPADTELIKRKEELIDLQQKYILAANDEKVAIKNIVKEGIEIEIKALKELISNYKNALDSQKDLYDYQKKVEEQTKNIATLQKQLGAYSGDVSEETKAQIQRIKVELENAREDLEETETDRLISEQKKMLDDLADEYEKVLNTRLDDLDALVRDMIAEVNKSAVDINTTLKEETSEVGYTMTSEMQSIWQQAADQLTKNASEYQGVIAMYGSDFQSRWTTTNSALSSIQATVNAMQAAAAAEAAAAAAQRQAEADAQKKAEEEAAKKATTNKNNTKPTAKKAVTTTTKKKTATTTKKKATTTKKKTTTTTKKKSTTTKKKAKLTNEIKMHVAAAIWNGNYGWSNDPTRRQRLEEVFGANNGIQAIVNKGYSYSSNYSPSGYSYTDMRKKFKGYESGLKKARYDESAWVNEKGLETILSPSNRAIITHISKGDAVLDDEATRNLFKMANNPEDYINGSGWRNGVVEGGGTIGNTTNNFGDGHVTFNLPNVKNYDEFLATLQKDKRFERLVTAISVDPLLGKNKSRKNAINF